MKGNAYSKNYERDVLFKNRINGKGPKKPNQGLGNTLGYSLTFCTKFSLVVL